MALEQLPALEVALRSKKVGDPGLRRSFCTFCESVEAELQTILDLNISVPCFCERSEQWFSTRGWAPEVVHKTALSGSQAFSWKQFYQH